MRSSRSRRSEPTVGPRALHVQPAYPKRRLWPWVVGAGFLLVLGIWELRIHRPGSATPAGVAPATSGSQAGSSLHGIAGRVLGPGGEPAARVTVVLLPGGSEAVTAADGSFGFQLDD